MSDTRYQRSKVKIKEYYEANKEEISRYRRNWHFQKKYGISLEEYDQRRAEQEYCCFLCGKHETEASETVLCVDHNHDTGQIRKLLCKLCNQGLGLFKENPEALRRAADYLEEYGESQSQITSGSTGHLQ